MGHQGTYCVSMAVPPAAIHLGSAPPPMPVALISPLPFPTPTTPSNTAWQLVTAQRPGPVVLSTMQQLRQAASFDSVGMQVQTGAYTSRARMTPEQQRQALLAFMMEAFAEYTAHSNTMGLMKVLISMISMSADGAVMTAAELASRPLPQGKASSRAFQRATQMALDAYDVANGIAQLHMALAQQQADNAMLQAEVVQWQDVATLLTSQLNEKQQVLDSALDYMAQVSLQAHMEPVAAAGVAQMMSATVLPITASQESLAALGLAQQLAQNVAVLKLHEHNTQAFTMQIASDEHALAVAIPSSIHSAVSITELDSYSLQGMIESGSDDTTLLSINRLQDAVCYVSIAQQQVKILVDGSPQLLQQQGAWSQLASLITADVGSLQHSSNNVSIAVPQWLLPSGRDVIDGALRSSSNSSISRAFVPRPLPPAASTVRLIAGTQQAAQQQAREGAALAAYTRTLSSPPAPLMYGPRFRGVLTTSHQQAHNAQATTTEAVELPDDNNNSSSSSSSSSSRGPQAVQASAAHTRRIAINKVMFGCHKVVGFLLDAINSVHGL